MSTKNNPLAAQAELLAKYAITDEDFLWTDRSTKLHLALFKEACATFLAPLGDTPTPGALTEGYKNLKKHFQKILDQAPNTVVFQELGKKQLACHKGCAHCCSIRVTVHPVEAIAIARHLQSTLSPDQLHQAVQSFKTYAQARQDLTPHEIIHKVEPCPLLKDQTCTVYTHRPLACIDYHSFDLKKCIEDIQDPQRGVLIPQDPTRKLVYETYIQALQTCTNKLGLQNLILEFIPSLLDCLEQQETPATYLQGQNPFTQSHRPEITQQQGF